MPFSKLGLLEPMQRVVEAAGYSEPTPRFAHPPVEGRPEAGAGLVSVCKE